MSPSPPPASSTSAVPMEDVTSTAQVTSTVAVTSPRRTRPSFSPKEEGEETEDGEVSTTTSNNNEPVRLVMTRSNDTITVTRTVATSSRLETESASGRSPSTNERKRSTLKNPLDRGDSPPPSSSTRIASTRRRSPPPIPTGPSNRFGSSRPSPYDDPPYSRRSHLVDDRPPPSVTTAAPRWEARPLYRARPVSRSPSPPPRLSDRLMRRNSRSRSPPGRRAYDLPSSHDGRRSMIAPDYYEADRYGDRRAMVDHRMDYRPRSRSPPPFRRRSRSPDYMGGGRSPPRMSARPVSRSPEYRRGGPPPPSLRASYGMSMPRGRSISRSPPPASRWEPDRPPLRRYESPPSSLLRRRDSRSPPPRLLRRASPSPPPLGPRGYAAPISRRSSRSPPPGPYRRRESSPPPLRRRDSLSPPPRRLIPSRRSPSPPPRQSARRISSPPLSYRDDEPSRANSPPVVSSGVPTGPRALTGGIPTGPRKNTGLPTGPRSTAIRPSTYHTASQVNSSTPTSTVPAPSTPSTANVISTPTIPTGPRSTSSASIPTGPRSWRNAPPPPLPAPTLSSSSTSVGVGVEPIEPVPTVKDEPKNQWPNFDPSISKYIVHPTSNLVAKLKSLSSVPGSSELEAEITSIRSTRFSIGEEVEEKCRKERWVCDDMLLEMKCSKERTKWSGGVLTASVGGPAVAVGSGLLY